MSDEWKHDEQLEAAMKSYVKDGLKRQEMLNFLRRDYAWYGWSLSTLDRRLRYFKIYYIDHHVNDEDVVSAVLSELEGPGQLLGYRAMHKKLRQVHEIKVPRNTVYAIMKEADPECLQSRLPCFKKKAKKGHFTSPGTNFVHSLDGHDKLMGYQNSTFPIAVYGCMDTCSRKLLWVKVWRSNSNPKLIGRFYLEYLYENGVMSKYLRIDRGTETGVIAAMHAFLKQFHQDVGDPMESVIYGPSTSNQRARLEKYFKKQLNSLLDKRQYDPHNKIHRSILAYIMVPIIQKHIDEFVSIWNAHRIREQKESKLPCGVPNHIYNFPECYGLQECGVQVEHSALKRVAEVSGVLGAENDYMDCHTREKCQKIIPEPEILQPATCAESFGKLAKNLA